MILHVKAMFCSQVLLFIPKSRFQSRFPAIIFILYHAIRLNNLVLVCSIWNNKRKNMSRLQEWKRTAKDSRLLHITQLQKPKTGATWEYLRNKISYSRLFNKYAHNWLNCAPWKHISAKQQYAIIKLAPHNAHSNNKIGILLIIFLYFYFHFSKMIHSALAVVGIVVNKNVVKCGINYCILNHWVPSKYPDKTLTF